MAGYKKYIQSLKPITFITFDADTLWDDESGWLIYDEVLNDESGNDIYALLHAPDVTFKPYLLGQPSMIPRQMDDQYSLTIAPFRHDDRNTYAYEKAFVEIPYEDRIKLDKSFNIMFMFNKQETESYFLGRKWDYDLGKYVINNNYYYRSLERTIFRKGLKIGCKIMYPYSSPSYLRFTFPDKTFNWNLPSDFHNNTYHLSMSHELTEDISGMTSTRSKIYLDGEIIYDISTVPTYTIYDGGDTTAFEIGGLFGDLDFDYLNDRQTTPLKIDQFAVFDKALTDDEVADAYKKVYPYITMIKRTKPALYYPCDDTNLTNFVKDVIKNDARYDLDCINNPSRRVDGIDRLYGDTAIEFANNQSMLLGEFFSSSSNVMNVFNPTGDFTIEFYASFNSSEHGVLFSLQDDTYPFRGIALHTNYKDNIENAGCLQLSVSDGKYICPPEFNYRKQKIYYNDDVMRHYVFIKRDNIFELWIDSILIDTIAMNNGALTASTNRLYLFGLIPGNLGVRGKLQHLAFYNKSLQKHQIKMRNNYMVRYVLQGQITLNGVPHKALVRVYYHATGQLIIQQFSGNDGYYNLSVGTDDYIDVTVLDPTNTQIRYFTYGADKCEVYEDLPYDY